jgi:hypothetical protein
MKLTGVDSFLTSSLWSPEIANFIVVSAAFKVGILCLVPVNVAICSSSEKNQGNRIRTGKIDLGRLAWLVISIENQGILEVAPLLTTPPANMMLRVYLIPHTLHF